MATATTVAEAKAALRDYDEKFLECRDLRHPWRILGYFRYSGEIHRRLICPRCDTERTDVWTSGGERLAHSYRYPDGYQIKSSGGVAPLEIRKEVVKRASVYRNEEDMVASVFTGNGRKKRSA